MCLTYELYGKPVESLINYRTIKIPDNKSVSNIYYFNSGEIAIIKLKCETGEEF